MRLGGTETSGRLTSHESVRSPLPACSTSSSDSVDVILDTVGHIVIQNIAIQETGIVSDVRGQ